jgi:hypothetical protein
VNKRSFSLLILTLLLSLARYANAQACNPAHLQANVSVHGPQEATRVKVMDAQLKSVANLEFPAPGGVWSIDQPALDKIQAGIQGRTDRSDIRLVWFQGDSPRTPVERFILPGEDAQTVCGVTTVPPVPVAAQPAAVGAALPQAPDSRSLCESEFEVWRKDLERKLGQRFTAIAFLPNGHVCAQNRDYGVSGDLIYVGVFKDNSFPVEPDVQFSKCDLQSPIPNNPEGDKLLRQSVDMKLIQYPPRQCFGTTAEWKISGKRKVLNAAGNLDDENLDTTFSLSLYERYRYTLQGGILSTPQHVHSFGLRKDGDVQRIFDKGPDDSGPEYTASVVLYALPRYFGGWIRQIRGKELKGLESLVSRNYPGRDVLHDMEPLDKIGLIVGVGLSSPNDRFVLGLSYEVIAGVNVIGVYESAKLKKLADGVDPKAPFTGTADQIPITEFWGRKVVFGLSLDMRYVTGLFKRGA